MDIARDVNRRAVRQAVSALAGLAVALTVVKVSVERRKRAADR